MKNALIYEESIKEKPRNFNNFTTVQKVGIAFSVLLGPIAILIAYFGIKAHNNAEKIKFENKLKESMSEIKEDLSKLSKDLTKQFPESEKSVSFKEQNFEAPAIKESNSKNEELNKDKPKKHILFNKTQHSNPEILSDNKTMSDNKTTFLDKINTQRTKDYKLER